MSIHRVCLILFALAGFLSIIDSASPSVSLLEAIRVTAVVIMLAVLEVMLVDREMIKRLIASIYVSALLPVGYTIFNVVTHHSQFTSGGFSRFEGTFSQPNPFAIYLTMLIVMGVALFPHLTQKKKIGMSVLLVCCAIVCLYYTFTRSAWIAAVIGLFAVAIMGRRRLMLGVMVGAIMVSLVRCPDDPAAFRRPRQLDQRDRLRVELARRGASTTGTRCSHSRTRIPITGIGLNMSSWRPVSRRSRTTTSCVRTWRPASSGRSRISRCSSAWCWWPDSRCGSRNGERGRYERSIAVGFAACVIAFVVISVVSNVITEVIVLWYYVAFAAAAYAVTRYRENAELRRPAAARRGTRPRSGGRCSGPTRPEPHRRTC